MECFWNVFETVTKLSEENGFHGNLVTKQNKYNKCFFKDIVVYFYWLETEFENLKKDQGV